jgi:2,4-dienoyl-CoA reductase (NADPH2)
VYEKGERIGGNLLAYAANDLARPEDLQSVVRHYEIMSGKLGIEMKFGTEANAKFMRSVLHRYDVCVVAAGARVDMDAYAHVDGRERLVDALDVAHGRVPPGKRIVVIGGGKIGLVLAEALRKGGAEVAIVEADKRIGGDVMPTFKWRHTTWVEELGIRVLTASRLARVTAEGAVVVDAKGAQATLPADMVIAASPRKSNQEMFAEFEWMVDELHGCGDALMPRGIDAAIHEGYRLGARI